MPASDSWSCYIRVDARQVYKLTCSVEGQEMMVWKGLDACRHQVAAQAQLHWNGGCKELLLQAGVQTAHVAQPVWLKLQHLLRFCRCVYLHQGMRLQVRHCMRTQDCLLPVLANSRRLEKALQGKARQGRAGPGRAGFDRVQQGLALQVQATQCVREVLGLLSCCPQMSRSISTNIHIKIGVWDYVHQGVQVSTCCLM